MKLRTGAASVLYYFSERKYLPFPEGTSDYARGLEDGANELAKFLLTQEEKEPNA